MLTKCHIEKCTGLTPMERSRNFKDSLRFFPEFFAFVVKKLDIKTGLLVRGGMTGLLTGGDLISKTGPFCCVLVFDGGSNKGATFSNGRLFLANTWGQIMKRHKPYFRINQRSSVIYFLSCSELQMVQGVHQKLCFF